MKELKNYEHYQAHHDDLRTDLWDAQRRCGLTLNRLAKVVGVSGATLRYFMRNSAVPGNKAPSVLTSRSVGLMYNFLCEVYEKAQAGKELMTW